MQEYQNCFKELWRKRRKGKSNDTEAACMLLATKLYIDYVGALGKSPGVEVEHFSEEWLKKNLPIDDRMMKMSIWMHFLCRLIERRNEKR